MGIEFYHIPPGLQPKCWTLPGLQWESGSLLDSGGNTRGRVKYRIITWDHTCDDLTCKFEHDPNVTMCDICSFLQPTTWPQPNNTADDNHNMTPNANNNPLPPCFHDCPKNEANHPHMKMNHNHPLWLANNGQHPHMETGNDEPRWVSYLPPPNHLSNTGATSPTVMWQPNDMSQQGHGNNNNMGQWWGGHGTTTQQGHMTTMRTHTMRMTCNDSTWKWCRTMPTRDDDDDGWSACKHEWPPTTLTLEQW